MNEFQSLSSLLKSALRLAGDIPVPDPQQQKLVACWQRQAGTAAAHSQPLFFTSGRLVVFVESASWGNEIRHRAQRLMEALAADGIKLNAIEVKVLPGSRTLPRRPRKPPPQPSPQNAEQLAQSAQTIEHPQLKESLLRLAKRVGEGNQTGE